MQSVKDYVIRGVSGVFLVNIIGIGLGLLNSVIFARAMGPDEYGLYSFVIETMMLVSIPVTLGLPTLLTREVAKFNQQKQFGLMKGILKWSGIFVLTTGIVMTFVTFVIVVLFKSRSKEINLFIWALPVILLSGMSQVRMGSLRGLKKVVQNQIPDVVIRPVLITGIVAILYWGFGYSVNAKVGIKINIFALFIAFSIGLLLLIKSLPTELKFVEKETKDKEWLKEALPFFLLGSISLINTKLSMVLLGLFRPAAEVGYYKIAVTASSMVAFLLTAVNMTIGPLISELYYGNRKDELQKVLTKTVRFIFFLGVLISLVYLFFGKSIISILYGKEYLPVYIPLIILIIGQLINIGAGSVGNVLNMTGNQRDVVKGQIAAAVVNIILNLVLVPLYGIIGASIATGASFIIWNIILVNRLKIKVGINSSIIKLGDMNVK